MAFDVRDYLSKNKIKLGTVEREVGTKTAKSYNDIRKTNKNVVRYKVKRSKYKEIK